MTMRRAFIRAAAGALLALHFAAVAPAVHAGTACDETASSPETAQKSLALAKKAFESLDSSGGKVAIIARIGQDLSKYGLHFSHLGFVVKNHPDGTWSVVHMLNQCGTDRSDIYVQGLGNFFSDGLVSYESAILTLPAEAQDRLERFLTSARVKRFYEPKYSVVAYPFATKYQNSNQWALETLASALAPEGDVTSRTEAQQWLKDAGYEPSVLNIGTMTRLGGRMFKANVAFDDHPGELRWNGKITVVSVESVFNFVRKRYPGESKRLLVDLLD